MLAMSIISLLLDFISPRICPICGSRLSPTEEDICAACNWQLPRTYFCRQPYDNEMAKIFWGRLPLERCASFFYYVPQSRASRLIYDIKYHSRPSLAYRLGVMVAEEFAREGFFDGIDVIVPVPITRLRRWHRGYNQSHLIAKGISDVTGIPVDTTIVRRIRFAVSQTRLSHLERAKNVVKAYKAVNAERVRDRHILIIDDIITTGATVCSCASEISHAVDVKISILSLGYTKA